MSGTVGGTDAAAIVCQHLGMPYFGRSRWDAYLRWCGRSRPWSSPDAVRWGSRMEVAILDWYAGEQRPGWELRRGVRLADEHRHGSLDALALRGADCVVVDAKRAVLRHAEWGTDEAPRAPLGYQVQLAWYGLLAEHAGYRVVACDLAIYDPLADANGRSAGRIRSLAWAELRPLALEWREIVDAEVARWQTGEHPPWDGSDAAQYWLALHCAPEAGTRRDSAPADPQTEERIRAWLALRRQEREIARQRREIEQALCEAIGDQRVAMGEGYVQVQRAGGGRRLDSRALRRDHPELWDQYSHETEPGVTLRAYHLEDA